MGLITTTLRSCEGSCVRVERPKRIDLVSYIGPVTIGAC